MHPRMNAQISESRIALLPEVHVGLAVAVENGLLVPVIRDAAASRSRRPLGRDDSARERGAATARSRPPISRAARSASAPSAHTASTPSRR